MMGIPRQGPGGSEELDLGGIDLTGVEVGNFKILDEKIEYEFEVQDAIVETSKEAGNKMVKLTLAVTFPVEDEGVKVYDYCSTAPAALWKLKSLAAACDMLSEDGSRIMAQSVSEFKGLIVRAGITHSVYQGRTSNKIAGSYMIAKDTPGLEG
jgi:hypothetical protein